ncbi:hypothetical protein GCM10008941_33370 [Rhizomicrobium palustre]
MHNPAMIRRILLGLLAVFAITTAEAAQTPEARYAAALAVLEAKCGDDCGFGVDESNPEEVKALDALWDATQDWTLAFLESNPGIALEPLKTELLNRHPPTFQSPSIAPDWVTSLADDLYAFSTRWDQIGTAFLVGKRNGRWTVLWDVRKTDTRHFPVLNAWRTDHGGGACRDDDLGYACGSLSGGIFPLKPDAEGKLRFGLGGTYAQGGGFTFTKQISFWRWDGKNAEPLLAHTYQQYIEDSQASVPDTPSRIVVRVKDKFKSVGVCCAGRQLNWTFRILPDRIEDQGKKPLYPEADAVDAVYAALQDHRSAEGAATPAALSFMGRNLPDGLGNFVTRRSGSGATVCLSSDAFESFFVRFRLVRRGGKFFIAKAERVAGDLDQHCSRQKGE